MGGFHGGHSSSSHSTKSRPSKPMKLKSAIIFTVILYILGIASLVLSIIWILKGNDLGFALIIFTAVFLFGAISSTIGDIKRVKEEKEKKLKKMDKDALVKIGKLQKCPFCGGYIDSDYVICPKCDLEL